MIDLLNLEYLKSVRKIKNSWMPFLEKEMGKDYFKQLDEFLTVRSKKEAEIYPSKEQIFRAFEQTSLDKVQVVILGQDPYPNKGDADGLCFSYRGDGSLPSSLNRIFTELSNDLGIEKPTNGNLEKWAKNGVFLLNTILTVEYKDAGAHKGRGWEKFTSAAIEHVVENRNNVVFMLWGGFAHKMAGLIEKSNRGHEILKAAHPVASVKDGFYTKRPFSKANAFLDKEVDWSL